MRTRPQQCFDTELSGCGSLPPRSFTRFRLVFSNFEGISGWGVKTSECMVLSSCCGQQANFFSKMLTYKRAYSGVKIIIVRARPGPQL